MKQALSDPELGIIFEEMSIEHTMYMLQPAPEPDSKKINGLVAPLCSTSKNNVEQLKPS